MSDIPNDLVPLPTMPYDQRPVSLPLDIEECRTAIWRVRGNVTEAAKLLKVPSSRLRKFIQNSPRLSAELKECNEILVDIAQDVVYDALTDSEDKGRRDSAARLVLTTIGKERGWGSGSSGGKINIHNNGGTVVIGWEDGSTFDDTGRHGETMQADKGDDESPQVIEGDYQRAANG